MKETSPVASNFEAKNSISSPFKKEASTVDFDNEIYSDHDKRETLTEIKD